MRLRISRHHGLILCKSLLKLLFQRLAGLPDHWLRSDGSGQTWCHLSLLIDYPIFWSLHQLIILVCSLQIFEECTMCTSSEQLACLVPMSQLLSLGKLGKVQLCVFQAFAHLIRPLPSDLGLLFGLLDLLFDHRNGVIALNEFL